MSLDWVKAEGATMSYPRIIKVIAGKQVEIPLIDLDEDDFLNEPVQDIPRGSSSGIGRHLASKDNSIVENVAEIDTGSELFYGDEDAKDELRKQPQLDDRGFDVDRPTRPQIYGSSDYRDLPDVTNDSANVFNDVNFDTEVQRPDMPGIIHESDDSDIFDEIDFSNIGADLLVTSDDPGYDVLKYLYADKDAWTEYLLDMAESNVTVDYDTDENAFFVSLVN